MQFQANPRRPWPATLISALSEYLHLSEDETGRSRQTSMSDIALEMAFDCIENELGLVILARDFTQASEAKLPIKLPFDDRSPIKLSRFLFDGQVTPAKIQKDSGHYRLDVSGDPLGFCEITLTYGAETWEKVDGALKYAVLATAARAYEFRGQSIELSKDIYQLLEPYRAVRLGAKHD